MQPDLDDTVIRPLRAVGDAYTLDDDDTIVRGRRRQPSAERPPAPAPPPVPSYSFVVNSHEPIGLDRPAYIGRRPVPPRIAAGPRPRLVRVPSPQEEVSGTHLELRQQGSVVIATDLRSTNGTRVQLPGSVPTRLRQGDSIVVTPGSLIQIGDGNVIEIQPLRRAQPPHPPRGAPQS